MERNLDYIRSKLIDGDLISTKYNRVLALRRNSQALLRFCIDRLTDDEIVDFCNLILLAANLVSDRFEFSHYDEYDCYEVYFRDQLENSSYLVIFLDEFPQEVTISHFSLSDESIDFIKHFKFTNLEDAEQIINEFLHQIYQSKEK